MRFLREDRRAQIDSALERIDQITDSRQLTYNVLQTKSQTRKKGYLYLRMSELDAICPREWVIGHLLNRQMVDKVAFSSVAVMDLGSAMHYWLQNTETYFGTNLLGYWTCRACGSLRRFGTKPKENCEFCNALPGASVYEEYMFRNRQPYRVVGKMDGILKVSSAHRVLEIKTIATPVEAPVGKDIIQLIGLMHFHKFDTGKMKLPIEIDGSCGYLIYFQKTFNFRDPVKVFAIKPNKTLIDTVVSKAEQFTQGIDSGVLPPILPACFSSVFSNQKAKTCFQKEECQRLQNVPNIKEYYKNTLSSMVEKEDEIDIKKEEEEK